MSEMRSRLIRLAYENPELRPSLVPLLKESASMLQSRFPSYAIQELDKLYDKLNKYERSLKRDSNPALREHKAKMSDTMDAYVTLLSKLKKAEAALYAGKVGTIREWTLKFPSHSVRDKVDSLYDTFSKYWEALRRERDSSLAKHKQLMSEALSQYVTFLAKLKDAELALYRNS